MRANCFENGLRAARPPLGGVGSTGAVSATGAVGNFANTEAAVGSATRRGSLISGIFGADRNGNGRLDRGPVPRSVRLRAVMVARFNYYDMRVPCQIK